MKRIEHWDTRHLHGFLRDRRSVPFAWGSNDCCLFAADAVQAISGEDIAADFRGKYTDEESAFALIKTVTGGDGVEDAAAYCATKAGMPALPHPMLAHRGDLVIVENEGRVIAGVVGLDSKVISVGESGILRLPYRSIKRAWRVGAMDEASLSYARRKAARNG